METAKAFVVFRGYTKNIGIPGEESTDEWICGIFTNEFLARQKLLEFIDGIGKFLNADETEAVRYYDKSESIFYPGANAFCEVSGGEKQWMRYDAYALQGS